MNENSRRIVFAGIGALLAVGGLFLADVVDYNPKHNHDEPIIIDNGPLFVDFKSEGVLLGPGKAYARAKACRVLHLDVYKSNSKIASEDLGDETIGLVLDGDKDDAPSVVFSRGGGSAPAASAPCDEQTTPAFFMNSTTPEFEYNSGLSKKKIKVKSNWKDRWIKKVRYYKNDGNVLSYVDVRQQQDNDKVRIILTVKK